MLQERAVFIRGLLQDTVLLEECDVGDIRPLTVQELEAWQALLSASLEVNIVGGLLGHKLPVVPPVIDEDGAEALLLIKGISNTKWHIMDVVAAPYECEETVSAGEHQWLLVLCLTYADATGDTPATAAPPSADDEVALEEIEPSFKLNDAIPRLSSEATSVDEQKMMIRK